jgi:hypothetical protein
VNIFRNLSWSCPASSWEFTTPTIHSSTSTSHPRFVYMTQEKALLWIGIQSGQWIRNQSPGPE